MKLRVRVPLLAVLLCAAAIVAGLASPPAPALTPAGDGWFWQNPQPMHIGEVDRLEFAGPSEVWAVGMGQGLGRSLDGGATWGIVATPVEGWLDVSFAGGDHVWLLAGGVVGQVAIRHTTDGGATWATSPLPRAQDLRSIDFVDATHGFAIGSLLPTGAWDGPATFFWTTDAGATWQSRPLPPENRGGRVEFVDLQHGFIALGDGRVGATDDGGLTWRWVQTPATGSFFRDEIGLSFVDADHGVVHYDADDPGYDYTDSAVVTSDGGATWRKVTIAGVEIDDVTMLGAGHLVVLGHSATTFAGVCCTSSDGGATWQRHPMSLAGWRWKVAGWPGGSVCAVGPSTIVTSADAGASWQPRSGGFIDTLYDVDCAGGAVWALGARWDADSPFLLDFLVSLQEAWGWRPQMGVLLHAPDGVTWREEPLPDGLSLSAIAFGDQARGWAIGSTDVWSLDLDEGGDTVFATNDGGGSWASQLNLADRTFSHICAVDAGRAWAATPTSVFRTTDGGLTWQESALPSAGEVDDLVFADALHGWATGRDTGGVNNVVFATVDGGVTWQAHAFPQAEEPKALDAASFVDADHGWVLTGYYEEDQSLLRTADGGVTWSAVTVPPGWLNDVAFVSPDVGWAVGDGVFVTTDSGDTWADVGTGRTSGIDDTLLAVAAADATHAWAVGGGGSIISTLDTTADTAPPTTYDDFDRWWHDEDVTIALAAGDIGGSGVARTEYRVDGELEWRVGTNAVFRAPSTGLGDGLHYLTYRSVDGAGNAESSTVRRVAIDTRGPLVRGLKMARRVLPGSRVRIDFRVDDALSPEATVRVTVFSGPAWTTVKRSARSVVRTGRTVSVTFVAPRQPGAYYAEIRAVDLAGNPGWSNSLAFRVVR